MSKAASKDQPIAIIGAGIIGLACGSELARRGSTVHIYDKSEPGHGASWAAAGMLAPAFEAAGNDLHHPDLFELCYASACLWPEWAKQLEAESQLPAGYSPGPSLAIAMNAEEAADLQKINDKLRDHPAQPVWLSKDELDDEAPSNQEQIMAAYLLPSDAQADNRFTLKALLELCRNHPRITLFRESIKRVSRKAKGWLLGSKTYEGVLITAGWESGQLIKQAVDVKPYGGQMLSVARYQNMPKRPIRAGDLYLVPKSDRLIIGATMEPGRVSREVDSEAILDLKRRAARICPGVANAETLESWAGIRPGTRDHAPLLGEVDEKGLYLAAGHYRNGILLAPLTAKIMADQILGCPLSSLATCFRPDRFLTPAR